MTLVIMLKNHYATSSADFPFTNKMYWTEFTIFLTLLISRMAWVLCPVPLIFPIYPLNCIIIVVSAKERGTSLLYESKVIKHVDNVPVHDVCLLLHREHYYALTSLSAWFGRSYYCMECERSLITRISTSVNQNTCNMCKKKYKPSYTGFGKECFGDNDNDNDKVYSQN